MKASRLGFLSIALTLGLAACGDGIGTGPGAGPGPAINSFTATPATVSAGQSSLLTWDVDSSATSISISPDVGDVTGETSITVTPSASQEYTLSAVGPDGTSEATTTVTVDDGNGSGGDDTPPPPPPGDPSAPMGTFGVSETADGTFTSDSGEMGGIITDNSDPRILTVSGGDTFYAQVAYADSDGISDITLRLVNSAPGGIKGDLSSTPQGGFTVGEPTGDCDLSSTPTTVTCVYPITVAPGTLDIEELDGSGDEFAYVFRVIVEDTTGAGLGEISDRGYVNIE